MYLCECGCVLVHMRTPIAKAKEYAWYVLHPLLSHPDPSRFYCNVTLIYVAPHLHQPTMSTLWKIYAAVHIKCDHINALMNAFSSISLNKMTPIQPVAAAISKRYSMPGMLIGLAFDSGLLPVLH